ncbi:DinB family protein [Candidatus Fermentibacterales bacterium]|nr:DinB family protein [Candidatus Fermentibacterales bacterium]
MEGPSYSFGIGSEQLEDMLEGLTAGDLESRFGEANSIHWIIGHLAGARRMLCGLLGMPASSHMLDWSRFFNMGSSHSEVEEWPDCDSLIEDFRDIGLRLCRRLDEMPPEELEKPVARPGWSEDAKLWQAVGFFAWHEAYHLGQIGLIRRLLDYPALV